MPCNNSKGEGERCTLVHVGDRYQPLRRRLVYEHWRQGETAGEIAAALGYSLGTVQGDVAWIRRRTAEVLAARGRGA
jgi:DNA-directed RNA polymerase specialized sigma24 family protein